MGGGPPGSGKDTPKRRSYKNELVNKCQRTTVSNQWGQPLKMADLTFSGVLSFKE